MLLHPKLLLILLSISSLVGIAVSCRNKSPGTDALADPVKIETGYIAGTVIGDVGKVVRVYRGIPYAAPPVGELRWKTPQAAAPWQGIRECTAFGKIAVQGDQSDNNPNKMPQSEDCLYLNVMTPADKATDRLPVMVWMHGGGYHSGSGSDALANLHRLPQHGIVQVNVNMRLNAFGLLSHPLLTKESPHNSSGNYMFLDMIAALRWVQKNIAAFGGNPDNVTIFGESGGGGKVATLMASPLAKGLFHRAICQSGSAAGGPFNGKSLKELEAIGAKFFAKLGIDKEADPLKAARAIPPDKIIQVHSALLKELPGDGAVDNSAVDGWFLEDKPSGVFQAAKQNAVPLIVMANLGELTGPYGFQNPGLMLEYRGMVAGQITAGSKAYAAIFDQVPAGWKQGGAVSAHGTDLLYLFADHDNTSGWWAYNHRVARQDGARFAEDPGLTEADRNVSEAMMKMWAQFARTGDPNVEGLVTWPPYQPATDQYLYIADPLQVRSGFSRIAQKQ